jgi:hypothetical protein
MKTTLSAMVLVASAGCGAASRQDASAEWGRGYLLHTPRGLEHVFLDGELLRRAASTEDFVEEYACIKALLSDIDNVRTSLVGVLSDPDHTPREKDRAAFILFTSGVKTAKDALASYYVSRLRDPEYHTFNYLDPNSAHRHGGYHCYVGKDDRTIMAQSACPMDEIEDIGRPALKYLVRLLADEDDRTRALAYHLVQSIVGRDALPYNVFTTDNSELVKFLSEGGWLGERRVSNPRMVVPR